MKKQWISFLCLLGFVVFSSALYAQQDWHTTGNAVNTNDSDFVGTINNMALNFKVANAPAGRIDPQGRVFLGYLSGNPNATFGATGIGYGALSNLASSAIGNTALGQHALHLNTTGLANTAVGEQVLAYNVDGNLNTSVGYRSLSSNDHGTENTAHGAYVLTSNHAGNCNTGIGTFSLAFNDNGSKNSANGWSALRNNTSGSENTATGYSALYENTVGQRNTASGAYALSSNTVGNYNTALGWSAIGRNTSGYENTGIGGWSLYSNTTGMANTATGMYSLHLNTTGSYNTSQGWNTLSHNQTGYENLASGVWSLYWNTTGYRNCAVGAGSLSGNTKGWANTAMGYYALASNTKGHGNVAYGYKALNLNITGNDNTALGNQAFLTGTTFNNSSAIGYQAQPLGSNEVVLGNASIIRLRCHTATITTGSDQRIKDNVQENVPGLEFIQKLRPVTYHINVDKLNAILEVKDSSDAASKYDVEKKQMTGFIAQEVEQAARKCNFEFSGVDQPDKEGGLYGLRYSEFVVPLVKASQELNDKAEAQAQEIKSQKETIQNLQSQIDELKALVQGCCNISRDKGLGQSSSLEGNRLDQNTPNPFDGNTVIRYYVVERVPNTYIRILTMEGIEKAQFPITQQGEGQISVSGDSFASGVYLYQLIVGGEMVASRKMVLTR